MKKVSQTVKRVGHTRIFTWAALRRTHMSAMPQTFIEEHRVQVDGLSFFYRTACRPGCEDAPILVLMHGMVVSGRYFLRLAEQLSQYYRVYIPDMIGFGESGDSGDAPSVTEEAEYLYKWLRVLDIEHAVFVGQSLGAQVVTQLAYTQPKLVQQLILISPTMDPRARWFPRLCVAWLWNMLREPPLLLPILIKDYIACGIPCSLHLLRSALRDRIEHRLPALSMPALVIFGVGDTIVSRSWIDQVVALLPDAQLCVFEGHIHDVHFTAPAQTAQAIHSFLGATAAIPLSSAS